MIEHNDPRLTAYALGELDVEAAEMFEQLLAGDTEAQAEVHAIREAAETIRAGLSGEVMPQLTTAQRSHIEKTAMHGPKRGRGHGWRRLLWVALSAAACLVLVAVLNRKQAGNGDRTLALSNVLGEPERANVNTTPADEAMEGVLPESHDAMRTGAIAKIGVVAGARQDVGSAVVQAQPAPVTQPPPAHEDGALRRRSKTAMKAPALASGVQPRLPEVNGRPMAAPAAMAGPVADMTGQPTPVLRTALADASTVLKDAEAVQAKAQAMTLVVQDNAESESRQGLAREAYDLIVENPFRSVKDAPLSTFSIDVDTASYSNMRRFLSRNTLPPIDAIRIEEMVNYFRYGYAPPTDDRPFAVHVGVASCPWQTGNRLVRIGLKGRVPEPGTRPPTNLVFLLDVSGSMQSRDKLPLLKDGMKMLVNQLGENDRVAIAVYAGASGLVLPSTSADRKEQILDALDRLRAGGSTNGGAGIELAYRTAVENSVEGGINRVILATDGDFNVGVTDRGSLTRLIEEKARTGVFLTVLGFGSGNLQDATMEQLADKGNGAYAYIDNEKEARKVLVEQLGSTLQTIAKDVKIQIEFNPAQVSAYRLIGYENRALRDEDFNDDSKDAGEIGAGHTVTAFYEVVPAGVETLAAPPAVDALRYQARATLNDAAASGELMTVKLRYKEPDGNQSELLQVPVQNSSTSWEAMPDDFQFSSAVALFGMILRHSQYSGNATIDTVLELAEPAAQADPHGTRAEFLDLARKAKELLPARQ